MREGWSNLTLKAAGVSLIDCEHKTPTAQLEGYPYVAIPQIKNGRIDLTGVRLITREDLTAWTRKAKPQVHDVVLSRRCNPGETAFVPLDLEFALGQNLVLLRSDGNKVYPPFLRWVVRGPGWWEQIEKYLNAGAIFDSLKCADVPNFEIALPDIPIQRRIATILSSLDEKIELNRQTNLTLEAVAQALFKEWFVDFNFPGATGEMQDSELGPIPVGWRVGRLDDALVLQRGFDLPAINRTSGEYPVIAASGPSGTHNEFKVKGLGVVTGRSGVLGKTYFVHDDFWPLNTSLWVKEFKNSTPLFAFYLLQGLDLGTFNAGSAVPSLNRNHVHNLPVLLPPMEVIRSFDKLVMPLKKRQRVLEDEIVFLVTTRDSLLPKLMNGEIEPGAGKRAGLEPAPTQSMRECK